MLAIQLIIEELISISSFILSRINYLTKYVEETSSIPVKLIELDFHLPVLFLRQIKISNIRNKGTGTGAMVNTADDISTHSMLRI